MPNKSTQELTRPSYFRFRKIETPSKWFKVYEISASSYVFYEPYHFEESISILIIGDDRAVLIDTGTGIGNIYQAVKEVTSKNVLVVNTHSHADHLGGNHQFNDIAMFEHPWSLKVSTEGISQEILSSEIYNKKLIAESWPKNLIPKDYSLPPFEVNHWLREGDRISLGNINLEVIHTPGEAPNHICLLDRSNRLLYSGDILLKGAVWTHLEGGSLYALRDSYLKLMSYINCFDHIMPSHNEPIIDKRMLPKSLSAVEAILSDTAKYDIITDPWGRRLKKYSFDEFSILTVLE